MVQIKLSPKMGMLNVAGAVALVIAAANATPLNDFGPASVLEKVNVPSHWSRTGNINPDAVLKMQIGLKQNNIKGLQAKLLDVSSPDSQNYGKWLSKEDVDAFTKPNENSLRLVKLWLAAHGLAEHAISHPTPDWLEVSVPITKAEKMLSAQYSMFYDSVSDVFVPRTTEYSIPKILREHIDIIQPTTAFHSKLPGPNSADVAVPKSKITSTNRVASCANGVNAECINDYYNVDYAATGNGSLVVTALVGDGASHKDADLYVSKWLPAAKGRNFKDQSIGNSTGNSEDKAVVEGSLDTQIAIAVGNPLPVTYLSVGPNDKDASLQYGDQLISLGTYLNSASDPPLVVSTSYLGNEPEFSSDYKDRICNEFMKASSRGISILFCSGDFGVAGLNYQSRCPKGYIPSFPASCPWVTAVGSTQFTDSGESAAQFPNNGSTGGGFSRYYGVPNYQSADTKSYISSLSSSFKGKFNPKGRGLPDISLVGLNWDIVLKGKYYTTGYGTSASTPAWASLIAQLNDYRSTLGKPALGFLNPLLYGNSTIRAALRDVTTGTNPGCGEAGFPSAKGWDPVTGLGTVDFAALRKAVS